MRSCSRGGGTRRAIPPELGSSLLLHPCNFRVWGRAASFPPSLRPSLSLRGELVLQLHAPAPRPRGAEGEPCPFPPGPSARRAARAAGGRPLPGRPQFVSGGQVGARRRLQPPPTVAPSRGSRRRRAMPALSGSPLRPALARSPALARARAPRSDAVGWAGLPEVYGGAGAGVLRGVALRRCRCQR